jgi:hypothetical protein
VFDRHDGEGLRGEAVSRCRAWSLDEQDDYRD